MRLWQLALPRCHGVRHERRRNQLSLRVSACSQQCTASRPRGREVGRSLA